MTTQLWRPKCTSFSIRRRFEDILEASGRGQLYLLYATLAETRATSRLLILPGKETPPRVRNRVTRSPHGEGRIGEGSREPGRSIDYLLEGGGGGGEEEEEEEKAEEEDSIFLVENRVGFNPQVRQKSCVYEWHSFKIERDINSTWILRPLGLIA